MARVSKVRGVEQAQANFRQMAGRPTGRNLDDLMVASLEPIRGKIASSAPRPSLRQGVVTVRRSAPSATRRQYWVSFKGMALRIAHLVEFGTHPHSLARGASRRKNLLQDKAPFHAGTPQQPFMRPAFESQKDNVIKTFGQLSFNMIVAGLIGRK